MIKIQVFDDGEKRRLEWCERLSRLPGRRFEVTPITKDSFEEQTRALEGRRRSARDGEAGKESIALDEADILILDFDLFDVDSSPKDDGTYVTGEVVAYLARCYSRCGLIVGVNQFGDNDFDLTLRGRPESFADVNIGEAHLSMDGLWVREPSGFRPWCWPVLPDALEKHQKRCKLLKEALDENVYATIGLGDEAVPLLTRSAVAFLGGRPEPPTIAEFLDKSGNAYRRHDKPWDGVEGSARVASARLGKWVERFLLPGQDLLVDAPHLVSRYPSLLDGDRKKLKTWNKTAVAGSVKVADLPLEHEILDPHRFENQHWVSRPVWWWNGISNDVSVSEVKDPWEAEDAPFVFCEDISQFVEPGKARPFASDVDSPYNKRYVVDPEKDETLKRVLTDVKYRPLIALSV